MTITEAIRQLEALVETLELLYQHYRAKTHWRPHERNAACANVAADIGALKMAIWQLQNVQAHR